MTALLLIHGRGQETEPGMPEDRVAARAATIRDRWVQALDAGLAAAGRPPLVDTVEVLFPFYGNDFRDAVDLRRGTGPGPDLVRWSTGEPLPGEMEAVCDVKARMLEDVTAHLEFDPRSDPAAQGVPAGVRQPWWELDELLRVPWLRAALQFLARRSGVSARVIEEHFTDVAYYLGCPEVREVVLGLVRQALAGLPAGKPVVVHGHSLGCVVAYDLLTGLEPARPVLLMSSSGSPLGLPAVQRHLLGHGGLSPAPVPAAVPRRPGGWSNAYDVRDVVGVLNPLAPFLDQAMDGQVVDHEVDAGEDPHSVLGHLADPSVAAAIGGALVAVNHR